MCGNIVYGKIKIEQWYVYNSCTVNPKNNESSKDLDGRLVFNNTQVSIPV